MNTNGLQDYCASNIHCDACGCNGGKWRRDKQLFICDQDIELMERLAKLPPAESEPSD